MWTSEHRRAANRNGLRYPSDLTDDEWALVAPMIPPGRHGGRKRSVNVREVLNGIFYVLWTGCQWKALPKDLPPKSTVHDYLELWNWDGTLERVHHALYVAVREQAGREARPDSSDHRFAERKACSPRPFRSTGAFDRNGAGLEADVTSKALGVVCDVSGALSVSHSMVAG